MGNKLGWIIAGGLLLVLLGYILTTFVFPSPDDPTSETTRLGVLDFHGPREPIEDVLGSKPALDQNAADDYAAAIAFYREHQDAFKRMFRQLTSDANDTLNLPDVELCRTLLAKIAPAGNKQFMAYTFEKTPKELRVSAFADGAEDFQNLSEALQTLMEHYRRTKQSAIEPAEALFRMGWHMMNERRRFHLVASGMEYQQAALPIFLQKYKDAGDAQKLEAAETYSRELDFAHRLTMNKQQVVWNFNAKPGDIFNILENDKDRTWRIEATLSLGMLKLRQKGHRGNMRKIEKLLQASQNSDDELIRAAGKVAQSCTSDDISNWQN